MNIRNYGISEGRVSKAPVTFRNQDGSVKVMLTVAVQDNYAGKDGNKGTQFINFEGFVRKDKVKVDANGKEQLGVYDYIHKGDLIGIQYEVRTNNYKDKDGKDVYGQVLAIQQIDLKESKNVTDARQAKAAETDTDEAAPAPEDAPFSE